MAGALPHVSLSLSLEGEKNIRPSRSSVVPVHVDAEGEKKQCTGLDPSPACVDRIQRRYSRPVGVSVQPPWHRPHGQPLVLLLLYNPRRIAAAAAGAPPLLLIVFSRALFLPRWFLAVAGGSIRAKIEVAEAAGAAVAGVVPPAKRRRVMVAPTAAGGRRGGGVGRRPRRRVHAEATFVQRLFQACRAVFKGPGTVPAPAEVDVLRAMLDRMRPEDVGLSSDRRLFRTRDADEETPTIYHTTIYKCENFSMEIFFLPPNAVIPLHNHPGMTVFNKLLLGSMHIKSYDWVDPDPVVSSCSSPDDRLRLAELVVDDAFTAPCDTSVLYPTTGGNMHQFSAIAPCAFLDILGPPYSLQEDRDCTYYAVADCASDLVGVEQEGRRLAWLREVDMPAELKIRSVPYRGPPISDTVTVQLSPAAPN